MPKRQPHPSKDSLRSKEATEYRRLYKLAAWQAARTAQLTRQPLCELCQQADRLTPATVVNHRRPHKGDMRLFLDPDNLQSLCAPCHDGPIQSFERTGVMKGSGLDGVPLDPNHHWR